MLAQARAASWFAPAGVFFRSQSEAEPLAVLVSEPGRPVWVEFSRPGVRAAAMAIALPTAQD